MNSGCQVLHEIIGHLQVKVEDQYTEQIKIQLQIKIKSPCRYNDKWMRTI